MILIKTEPRYYLKYNRQELKGIISKFLARMRLKKYKMDVERIYIPKANGKMRPIGSPSLDSRMVYATVTEFLKL